MAFLEDIKLEDFDPEDHKKQSQQKQIIKIKQCTELIKYLADKMHLYGFGLSILIRDSLILVYLLENKCNF